ncbi:hypothetical protein WICPIJ_006638 [Wickerhamomyces pijperi]|uniref:Uncharacterized protein n=1 Tax=Wickerhamomyces pijperi TaxID=599730 RepID=A0A9P8TKU4_WICPI|nr:hypothetical protein WICPIJ_006638 [Wickerhamomyces pijperi]
MEFKFLLLLTLKVSKWVTSKPSKVSRAVSEITKESILVIPVFNWMESKAGKVTKLMEPTADKAGKAKVVKMVKAFNLNSSEMEPKELAVKEVN